MPDVTPVKRPRHLMDPANLQRQVNDQALTNVQQWVMSVLVVTTILHLSAGMVIAAVFLGGDQLAPQIGLNVIAGLFAACAIVAGLAIHKKPLFTPWLLLALVPTAIGLLLTLAL